MEKHNRIKKIGAIISRILGIGFIVCSIGLYITEQDSYFFDNGDYFLMLIMGIVLLFPQLIGIRPQKEPEHIKEARKEIDSINKK